MVGWRCRQQVIHRSMKSQSRAKTMSRIRRLISRGALLIPAARMRSGPLRRSGRDVSTFHDNRVGKCGLQGKPARSRHK
jgi:hypothetical protein